MARKRVGVVVLVPEPLASEVQGLRRACGDPSLDRIAPHLTLVPPVNVNEVAIDEAVAIVRRAAGSVDPFTVTLGPAASFAPDSATLHLAIGDDDARRSLHHVRDAVFAGPLHRALQWPFVPHVTLTEGVDEARLDAGVRALADFCVEMPVRSLHLLSEQRDASGVRWMPLADHRLGGPVVVGRGGLPLDLWTSDGPDPEAVRLLASCQQRGPAAGEASLTVAARRRDELVGVLAGTRDGEVEGLAVAAEHRGQGVARHLRARYEYEVDQLRRHT